MSGRTDKRQITKRQIAKRLWQRNHHGHEVGIFKVGTGLNVLNS